MKEQQRKKRGRIELNSSEGAVSGLDESKHTQTCHRERVNETDEEEEEYHASAEGQAPAG